MIKHNNIWIPHVPKNAGSTIANNIRDYCLNNKNFDVKQNIFDWQNFKYFIYIKNNNTNNEIKLDHDNPLNTDMKNWLKILIIRNPIDRFISYYNFSISLNRSIGINDNRTFDEFIETYNKYTKLEYLSHLTFLNNKQIVSINPLIKKFTLKNICNLFDYIVDIHHIQKIFTLIEDKFLQTKIEWKTIIPGGYLSDIFKKDYLTDNQLNKICQIPEVKKDIYFYKNVKICFM